MAGQKNSGAVGQWDGWMAGQCDGRAEGQWGSGIEALLSPTTWGIPQWGGRAVGQKDSGTAEQWDGRMAGQ